MENETPAAPPETEAKPPKKKVSPIWWAALGLIAALLVMRFGLEYRKNAVGKGDELAKEVATLTEQAKKAKEIKDLNAAKESLSRAILILRDADQFRSHPIYISTLVDMGALLLSGPGQKEQGPDEVAEGRKILTEAWDIAKGLDARTRWRIARDLGLGAVLAGDMAEAERWYQIATELVPEDSATKDRLNTLRNAKKWK